MVLEEFVSEDVEVLKDEVVSWQILREFTWGL